MAVVVTVAAAAAVAVVRNTAKVFTGNGIK